MKPKSASIHPDLFEQDEPRALPVPSQKELAGNVGRSPAARDRGGTGRRGDQR